MNDFVLSCESTADLSREHFEKLGVHFACFSFIMDGETYLDDLGNSMPFDEFYKKVGAGADVKTSQVNTESFVEHFESLLKEGKDVLHVCLSSGISGVINSANMAKEMLQEKYKDRKIYVVDSLSASGGFGLLMDKVAELKNEGYDIDKLKNWIEDNRLRVRHWFFTSDLTHLIRGGRISKVSGAIGMAFGICPLMDVNKNGELKVRFKIRGKNNVIKETVEKMKEQADDGLDYSEKCFITNAACPDDARKVADLIEENFKKMNGKVLVNSIGTVIGCHTGPGTVALFFWGKKREEE
jgi:DegV family protein with EDD domain